MLLAPSVTLAQSPSGSSVEVIKGKRGSGKAAPQPPPEVQRQTPAHEQELSTQKAALDDRARQLDAREHALNAQKADAEPPHEAKQPTEAEKRKALENLAKKTAQEYQNAANALGGE